MLTRPCRGWIAAALLGLLPGASAALAQTGRPWVDPPADLGTPVAPAGPQDEAAPPSPDPTPVEPAPAQPAAPLTNPAPSVGSAQPDPAEPPPEPAPPAQSAQRPPGAPEDRLAVRAAAARGLAIDYLNSWSAPNAQTLDAAPEFYAARVLFHGRLMSVRSLLREKRRFVRRWPERQYRPRTDTMGVACEPKGESCTVRSVFDFMAVNSKRGRRSKGIATLELVVSFAGERPVIVSENSLVHGRGSGERNRGLEGAPDG